MEVHLPQHQEAQLNELANITGGGTDEWFQAEVQVGIDQVERGEFIEEADMDARVERMLRC